MGKAKQKINVKRFLEDFRTGKTDDQLMAKYGLAPASLDKLLTKLMDESLLESGEIRARRDFPETVALPILPTDRKAASPKSIPASRPKPGPSHNNSLRKLRDKSCECPQCNAPVTGAMLLCPECGHVLPGKERWEQVEPRKRFVDRIPPKALGCVIAFPIAVFLALVFRDIIIPMTHVTIEKRADHMRREKELNKSSLRPAQEERERPDISNELRSLVKGLIDRQVFSEANAGLTVLTTGPLWEQLSESEQMDFLEDLRAEMLQARKRFRFEVVDSLGVVVGQGSEDSISLTSRQTP
jgi:hypothetical protein